MKSNIQKSEKPKNAGLRKRFELIFLQKLLELMFLYIYVPIMNLQKDE
jgi:hypothetical protein